jgi:hypothetical protein
LTLYSRRRALLEHLAGWLPHTIAMPQPVIQAN